MRLVKLPFTGAARLRAATAFLPILLALFIALTVAAGPLPPTERGDDVPRVPWLSTSWAFRQHITVENRSDLELADYQVRIVIPRQRAMNADYSDVRFTTADGVTELPYFLEEYDGLAGLFWVRLPRVSPCASEPIFLYFGNVAAASESNGWDTFSFFDDFTRGRTAAKHPSNPLLIGDEPSVIRVGAEYWMYYNVVSSVYRRTSSDGVAWSEPVLVLSNAGYCDVQKYGSTFRMVYNPPGLAEVRLATSQSGVAFIDQGALIGRGHTGDWDELKLADPSEIRVGNTYYLYYGGWDRDGNPAIGLATSRKGLPNSYTKEGIVVFPGSGFDSRGTFDPAPLQYAPGKYVMFYTGFNGEQQQASYATSTDLRNWIRSGKVLYRKSEPWELSGLGPNEPTAILEDGLYKVWYRGNPETSDIGYLTIPQGADGLPDSVSPIYHGSGRVALGSYLHVANWSASGAYVHLDSKHQQSRDNQAIDARFKVVAGTNNVNLCTSVDPNLYRDVCIGPAGDATNAYLFQHQSAAALQIDASGPFSHRGEFNTYTVARSGVHVRAAISSRALTGAEVSLEGISSTPANGVIGFYVYGTEASVDWLRARAFAEPEPSVSFTEITSR
jgi:predicted GH43/DUF377 family glycosyl hydrolase